MFDPTYPQRLAEVLGLVVRALDVGHLDTNALAGVSEALRALVDESAEQIQAANPLHASRAAQDRLTAGVLYLGSIVAVCDGRECARRAYLDHSPEEEKLLLIAVRETLHQLRPALHFAQQWVRQIEQRRAA